MSDHPSQPPEPDPASGPSHPPQYGQTPGDNSPGQSWGSGSADPARVDPVDSFGQFVKALFDLKLNSLISKKAASYLYILQLAAIALWSLFVLTWGFHGDGSPLLALVLVAVIGGASLVGARLVVEFIIVQFHQAESLQELVAQGRERAAE